MQDLINTITRHTRRHEHMLAAIPNTVGTKPDNNSKRGGNHLMQKCMEIQKSTQEHDFPQQCQSGHDHKIGLDIRRQQLIVVMGLLRRRRWELILFSHLLELPTQLFPLVEYLHLLQHQKQRMHKYERMTTDIEAIQPLMLLRLALLFRLYLAQHTLARFLVNLVKYGREEKPHGRCNDQPSYYIE